MVSISCCVWSTFLNRLRIWMNCVSFCHIIWHKSKHLTLSCQKLNKNCLPKNSNVYWMEHPWIMNWWHLAKIPIIKTLKFSKKNIFFYVLLVAIFYHWMRTFDYLLTMFHLILIILLVHIFLSKYHIFHRQVVWNHGLTYSMEWIMLQ
jgi:hypothetical protein